jgi:DNA-binding transcriptional ArsR family regulator
VEAQPPPDPRSLVALLGRTRAAVLLTIADRPSLNTTELAAALGTSQASASQHATVLREAGLVTTRRHNGSALHTLSTCGTVLLARPRERRSA